MNLIEWLETAEADWKAHSIKAHLTSSKGPAVGYAESVGLSRGGQIRLRVTFSEACYGTVWIIARNRANEFLFSICIDPETHRQGEQQEVVFSISPR